MQNDWIDAHTEPDRTLGNCPRGAFADLFDR